MAKQDLLSVTTVRKLLDYNPETGKFVWRPRPKEMFKSERGMMSWNSRLAGKAAFTNVGGHGYLVGYIFNKCRLAHRLAYAHHFGHWPKQNIDHINGDTTDNRIANLRDVSTQENLKNQKMPSHNTSGVCGVYWNKPTQKWLASISINGKNKHIGLFGDIEEAKAARKAAEIQYGYHPNHGRS